MKIFESTPKVIIDCKGKEFEALIVDMIVSLFKRGKQVKKMALILVAMNHSNNIKEAEEYIIKICENITINKE